MEVNCHLCNRMKTNTYGAQTDLGPKQMSLHTMCTGALWGTLSHPPLDTHRELGCKATLAHLQADTV